MGRKKAIKFYLDRTFEEKNFKCDRNIIKDGKNEVAFEPLHCFHERKKRLFGFIPRFWKGTRTLVFFVDGAINTIGFGKVTKDMKPFWTQKEEKKLVRREMKKSMSEHKPMKWSMVLVLLVPTLACLVLLLKLAFQGGF